MWVDSRIVLRPEHLGAGRSLTRFAGCGSSDDGCHKWITPLETSLHTWYGPLDGNPYGRIIKDVMIRQLGEDKKRKKGNIPTVNTDWLARNLTPDLSVEDDIDPADFFNPEELAIGRRDIKSTRP